MPIRPVATYVTVVCIGGAAMVALVLATGFDRVGEEPGITLAFALLRLLAELLPIKMVRGREEKEINVATTFTVALLLVAGPAPTLLLVAVSAAVGDLAFGKPFWKAAFNALQMSLAVGAAATVLTLLRPEWVDEPFVSLSEIAPVLAAGVVMFVVNHSLVAGAVSLAQGLPIASLLLRDLGFQAMTYAVMVSLAPVMVVAARESLVLVPLLLVPLAGVHATARALIVREHQATHDPLTDLNNRSSFHAYAAATLDEAARSVGASGLAVLLIDLDRFKEVNDTLGHHTGDLLLKQIGPRLRASLAPGDVLARFGGDEFAILLSGISGPDAAMERAREVLEGLEQPFELSGLSLDIEASVGIALHPTHGADIDTLIQRADVAMYLAKDTRAGCVLYSPERDPYSPEKLTLLGELRRALEREECVLHYQPKARLDTGEITGVEVLVRWQHPDRGLLGPDVFVPLAERTGLSRTLTLYVLERALQQCRRWEDLGLDVAVAVNLSVRNLHDASFPAEVRRLMEETRVTPAKLQFEITESTVMADPPRVMRVLLTLRSMGLELALDDFGTGYSSLQYLKRLPVRELKIDKSFVTGMCRDTNDAVIVRSTIELARNLGLRTVAEGVEDGEVWDELRSLGCDVAQGYWLGRPVPADEFTQFLLHREAADPATATQGGASSVA